MFSVKAQVQLNDEVTLNVSVIDKKDGFVKNLTDSNFEIFNRKTEQKIKSVSQEDTPVSIGILIDLSDSIKDLKADKMEATELIKNGLAKFIEQSNPANQYFIMGFGEQSKIILDNTQDVSEISKAFENFADTELGENTAFYDALYQSAGKISESKYEKRALILITDGQDNVSEKDFGDVKRILKEKNIIVYSVSLLAPQDINTIPGLQGQGFLEEFCKITGGWNLIPKKVEEVYAAFSYIAGELRNQYQITFDLESKKEDREWHKLKVKLVGDKDLRKATIRTRVGFYTEKKEN